MQSRVSYGTPLKLFITPVEVACKYLIANIFDVLGETVSQDQLSLGLKGA
jgi:hypothetical protein